MLYAKLTCGMFYIVYELFINIIMKNGRRDNITLSIL